MRRILLIVLNIFVFISCIQSQVSESFELRYFTKDKDADGITDFKGENALFNTEQRIDFLNTYAKVAKEWFSDSGLDMQVNESSEIERFIRQLKEQPTPQTRTRIKLENWKAAGIKSGSHEQSLKSIQEWDSIEGLSIYQGTLQILNSAVSIEKAIDTLQWRFFLEWKAMSKNGKFPLSISLKENNRIIAEAGFHTNGNIFFTENDADRMATAYRTGQWYDFKLEVDLVHNKYNFYIDGKKVGDWISLKSNHLINRIQISGGEGIFIDKLKGIQFDTAGCTTASPYIIKPFINESFDVSPSSRDWYLKDYDDSSWDIETAPIVRGGPFESGEDLYLRKKIWFGSINKAYLSIETLDPGGEVWINGQVIFVTHEKYPVKIDISDFLLPFQENTIGIRVYSYFNEGPLYHSPLDRNTGWFCGRSWIDLTGEVNISQVKIFTRSISSNAIQFHKIGIRNNSDTTFEGSLKIDYYPWFPNEGSRAASFEIPVRIFARDTIQCRYTAELKNPLLWTHDKPNLYRVQIKILAGNKVVDDEVVTSGIRTISQDGGTFRINGAPELLGGAQTMGFRMPIENMAKWNRCPPKNLLADELLACKKLGNTLRIHVHSGGKYAHSVNDPRVAEMADQLGIMLIWPTPSWIREGEWGGIDFTAYPLYMEQVFNHPSIIIWEGANHPNKFSDKDLEYSNRFITKIYNTIYTTDSSRLIAPTSFNRHFIYNNDEGTIDRDSNIIVPCKEWTAPMIVRGNQDAITGYGAEWNNIRNWPDPYRLSFLQSKERAYINFEHEESIGMQNFELVKGKPWYQLPSYENKYDTGSIGREFEFSEWQASQAWQAFSAWESMKWQRMFDIDGFSWCCLHGGPNSGTYRKPLIDAMGHAKLGFYSNKMILQDVVACSENTDIVYSRKDALTPLILSIGEERNVRLKVIIRNLNREIIDTRLYSNISLEEGRNVKEIPSFRPKFTKEGYYIIEYYVLGS